MAKKRGTPTTNPIRQDLIDELARPVPRESLVPSVGEGTKDALVSRVVEKEEPAPVPVASDRASAADVVLRPKPRRRTAGAQDAVQVKARFVPEEAQEIDRFRRHLSNVTGCRISTSHLTRALWMLALQAGEEVEKGTVKAPQLKRPPHGNPVAMAEYEDQLSSFLLRAIKQVRAGG